MLPRMYMPVGILITGIGMAICFVSPNLPLIFIGSIIGGARMGIGLPGMFARVSDLTPAAITSAGVGLVVAAQGVRRNFRAIWFSSGSKYLSIRALVVSPLAVSAIGLILLALVWVLSGTKAPKQELEVTLNHENKLMY